MATFVPFTCQPGPVHPGPGCSWQPVVPAVVGYDFGSSVAAWCARIRPDVFRGVVLMSAPFAGPPALPFDTAHEGATERIRCVTGSRGDIHAELAALHARGSTTSGITRPARPTPTCAIAHRGYAFPGLLPL